MQNAPDFSHRHQAACGVALLGEQEKLAHKIALLFCRSPEIELEPEKRRFAAAVQLH